MSVSVRLSQALLASLSATTDLLLSPSFTLITLGLFRYQHARVIRLLDKLPLLPRWRNFERYISILQVLLGFGLLRKLNVLLSKAAENNWRLTRQPGWNWPEEVAVITGGSGGIGQRLAEVLASRGAHVAVLDIQPFPEGLNSNKRIKFYECDLTSAQSVKEVSDCVKNDLGNPSLLINNAGILWQKNPLSESGILHLNEKQLQMIFGVNCISHWYTVQQFLPSMVAKNKGHVVTIASMATFVSCPMMVDYCATKAAALAFHEGLRSELKHILKAPGVITTVVHPTFTATPMTIDMAEHNDKRIGKQLSRDFVADKILERIFSCRGGQLILPEAHSALSGLRGWPAWLQEMLRDSMGRDTAAPFEQRDQ